MPGPTPGALCTVCNHPDVKTMNAALAAGRSQREIGRVFRVGHDAVRRHVASRHPGVVIQGDSGVLVPSDATLKEDLGAVLQLLRKKLAAGSIRTDEIRELRITTESLDKLRFGEESQTMSYRDLEGWVELEADLVAALEPFPEARKAVASILRARLEVLHTVPAPEAE